MYAQHLARKTSADKGNSSSIPQGTIEGRNWTREGLDDVRRCPQRSLTARLASYSCFLCSLKLSFVTEVPRSVLFTLACVIPQLGNLNAIASYIIPHCFFHKNTWSRREYLVIFRMQSYSQHAFFWRASQLRDGFVYSAVRHRGFRGAARA